MLEAPLRYPMLRGRRRRERRARPAWLSARLLRIVAVLALIAVVLGGIVTLARQASAPDARGALQASRDALQRGNYSAARNHAIAATQGADAGEANTVLARSYLLLGDGVAAEGALNRAVAAGISAASLRHLFADAWLMQGDPDRALAEIARAGASDAAYVTRVRARALAAKGDVPGATALLQALTKRDPRDAAAYADLGQIRFDAGDILGAARRLARPRQPRRRDAGRAGHPQPLRPRRRLALVPPRTRS